MVEGIEPFGLILLVAAVVVPLALLSNRISARLRVPAPASCAVTPMTIYRNIHTGEPGAPNQDHH